MHARVLAVLVTFLAAGVAIVSTTPPARGAWDVASESMTRGTSTGFGNQGDDDGVTNVKTEVGTSRTAWIKPNADLSLTDWDDNNGCVPGEWCHVADDPIQDGNTTFLAEGAGTSWIAFADWTLGDATFDSVTGFWWAKKNQTADPEGLNFSVATEAAGPSLARCLPSILPILTQAFSNVTSAAFTTNCETGGVWTIAGIGLLATALRVFDAGAERAAVTAAGITVAYRNDFSLDFASVFNAVVGEGLAVAYDCTTTDAEGLDLYVNGALRDSGICAGAKVAGFVAFGTFDNPRDVTVRLASPTTTGDTTESTYTFDVLAIVGSDLPPPDDGGIPDLADRFPCSYKWLTRSFACSRAWTPPATSILDDVRWILVRELADGCSPTPCFVPTETLDTEGGDRVSLSTSSPPWDVGQDSYIVLVWLSFADGSSTLVVKPVRDDDRPWVAVYAAVLVLVLVGVAYVRRRATRGRFPGIPRDFRERAIRTEENPPGWTSYRQRAPGQFEPPRGRGFVSRRDGGLHAIYGITKDGRRVLQSVREKREKTNGGAA